MVLATRKGVGGESLPEDVRPAEAIADRLRPVADRTSATIFVPNLWPNAVVDEPRPRPEALPVDVAKGLKRGEATTLADPAEVRSAGELVQALTSLGVAREWQREPVQPGGVLYVSSEGRFTRRISVQLHQPGVASVARRFDAARERMNAEQWISLQVDDLRAGVAVLIDHDVIAAAEVNEALALDLDGLASSHYVAVAVVGPATDPNNPENKEA